MSSDVVALGEENKEVKHIESEERGLQNLKLEMNLSSKSMDISQVPLLTAWNQPQRSYSRDLLVSSNTSIDVAAPTTSQHLTRGKGFHVTTSFAVTFTPPFELTLKKPAVSHALATGPTQHTTQELSRNASSSCSQPHTLTPSRDSSKSTSCFPS